MSEKQRFNGLRRSYDQGCRGRDGNKCIICGRRVKLSVHHIAPRKQMPNDGYSLSNGATLCDDPFTVDDLDTENQVVYRRLATGNYHERQESQVMLFSCHQKAELYYINGVGIDGYRPDDLFRLIGSSYEQAKADSEKL